MPVPLIVSGVGYNYPVSGDENWAENATNWAVAVTQNLSSLSTGLANVNAGIFSLADGSAAAPSLRFTNSPTTGMYRASPTSVGFSAAGANVGVYDTTGAWAFGPITANVTHTFLGSLSVTGALGVGGIANVLSLQSGTISGTTGTFSGAVSVASLASAGAVSGTSATFSAALAATTGTFSSSISATSAAFSGQVTVPVGSVSAPGLAFTGALGTGLYRPSANSLGLAANGIQGLFLDNTGKTNVLKGLALSANTITGTTYTAVDSDTLIYVNNAASSVAVTLPANLAGRFITVKDVGGAASTNNITITPASGTIDGSSNTIINTNLGSVILYADGTNWRVVGGSGSSVSGAVKTVSGNSSLAASDNIVLVNQSAACTIILPPVVKGKIIEIKDFSGTATTNNITVSQNASELIDGQKTTVMTQNYQSVRLVSDGTNWAQL